MTWREVNSTSLARLPPPFSEPIINIPVSATGGFYVQNVTSNGEQSFGGMLKKKKEKGSLVEKMNRIKKK